MDEFFGNIEKVMALIDHAVKTAEKSTTDGKVKRDAAVKMVVALANVLGLDLTPYVGLIGSIVDITVFTYNLLGIFTHKNK